MYCRLAFVDNLITYKEHIRQIIGLGDIYCQICPIDVSRRITIASSTKEGRNTQLATTSHSYRFSIHTTVIHNYSTVANEK